MTGAPLEPKVPEILAPAGGRAQFFAALNAGADAVYLGLKAFNARARAENFSPDDLRELVPLAHAHGMKILVTMNVLIKEAELADLIATLGVLEELEVDAIIVQDLGVAKLAREFFPGLRLHASTQMAVHNLAGVRQAAALGFRRVVLARELTALEMKKIRAQAARDEVEIEAFCHGSLCYSYSGLCFFSGAEDARSGNRGECAYTCRQPYKIVSEPGHGFLFSMRDLDTSNELKHLVDAGIDTLKIEGRKKDAQYVASTVRLYRQRLDAHFGRKTLRDEAPGAAHAFTGEAPDAIERDLALSFQRGRTSFFLKSRYHENVVDLANPTHQGIDAGFVQSVVGRRISFVTACPLEKFDGLRVTPDARIYHSLPQDGAKVTTTTAAMQEKYENRAVEFSLRDLFVGGRPCFEADAGDFVEIELPPDAPNPKAGDRIQKIRSADLKRRVEKLSDAPLGARLRPMRLITLALGAALEDIGTLRLTLTAGKLGTELATAILSVPAVRATGDEDLRHEAQEVFEIFGDFGFASTECIVTANERWFVPRGKLKELKKRLGPLLAPAYDALVEGRRARAVASVQLASKVAGFAKVPRGARRFTIKTDRLETLNAAIGYAAAHAEDFSLAEVLFEPKRSHLGAQSPTALADELRHIQETTAIKVGLAIPTVLRAWDEPLLKRWLGAAAAAGIRRFELGNLGAQRLLADWGHLGDATFLSGDFTLYALNSVSHRFWREQGIDRVCLSIEDDLTNLTAQLQALAPEMRASAQVVIFKDTPLFIAEACSLTALHNGCPTAKVCGYRTLEVENPKGERFFVAHEACKSIVYGKNAYSLTADQEALRGLGLSDFRVDFLTRAYTPEEVVEVLDAVRQEVPLSASHSANFHRSLL